MTEEQNETSQEDVQNIDTMPEHTEHETVEATTTNQENLYQDEVQNIDVPTPAPEEYATPKPISYDGAKEGVRINKFLASCGYESRRAADRLIAEGRVEVNGTVIDTPGIRVSSKDFVKVDGRHATPKEELVVLLNKPRGFVCSREAQGADGTVFDLLPPRLQHLNYVGRLDADSEGLIIMTNRGDLGQTLSHPSSGIEKEYWVTLDQNFDNSALLQLLKGLRIPEGNAKAKYVCRQSARRACVVLEQGLKRQIRQMFACLGLRVKKLVRVRIGSLWGGDLEPASWRQLDAADLALALKNPPRQRKYIGANEAFGPRAERPERTEQLGSQDVQETQDDNDYVFNPDDFEAGEDELRGNTVFSEGEAFEYENEQERKPFGDRRGGDRPQRSFGDRPQRSFGDRPSFGGDRPRRSFGDRPSFGGDRPQRSFGDRPQRDGDRPQRSFGDRPSFGGDRPRRSFGDRPSFGEDRPQRSFGDRPQRDGDRPSFGGDRPQRSFGDRPSFGGDRPRRSFGDRPQRDGDRPSFGGDRPQRSFGDRPSFGGDRPRRSFGDRPSFGGDRPQRSFGDRPQRDGDRPQRSFGDRPQRDGDRPSFGGDRPQRSFGDRPSFGGDRPRRSFGDRPSFGGDRPQRSFGDRPQRDGDRPQRSFGDRPQRDGDRPQRSFGDRPSFGGGERRGGFGSRPPREGGDRPSFGGGRSFGGPRGGGFNRGGGDRPSFGGGRGR